MFSKLTLLFLAASIASINGGMISGIVGSIIGSVKDATDNINGAVKNVGSADIGLVKTALGGGGSIGGAVSNVIEAKIGLAKAGVDGAVQVGAGTLNGVKDAAKGILNGGTGNTGNNVNTNCTTTTEIKSQHNNAQQFLSTGGQKIGALAARYGSFALFWNSTKEAALIDLIHGFAAFKDQADVQAATLKTNIKDAENKAKTATGNAKAKLDCGVAILKKDLASVNEANDKVLNDTRVQAPFEKAQEDIRHLFDNFSTTDCPSFDKKVTELVARMKSVSDEGLGYGLKRADELKVQIEAQKLREGCDLDTLSNLQNQYKDRVLHVLSFLAPEKTYVDNAITKAEDLLQTVDESKKACLASSIDKLQKLSAQLEGQTDDVYPRLLKL